VREVVDGTNPVETIAVGLSGWSSDHAIDERLLASVVRQTAARRTLITSDGVTAFLGAANGRPGVVVAAGTGVIAVAADGQGRWTTADGLGHALGDRGGGFWIAREGLWLALRLVGRQRPSALVDRAEARFGPLEAVADGYHAREDRVAWIAGFATDLAGLAREGERAAARIWTDAAAHLGGTACAAADRVFPRRSPISVVLTAGLASAETLLAPGMRARIERERPGSTLRTIGDGPGNGTIRLALDEDPVEWFPGAILEHRR
jgi:N-acetylglucosamine kinase-like BadF-type ATPase